MTPVEYEGTFWGDGNVLYFYGGDGYMTLYICQRSSLIHIKCVHFTICKLYHKTLVKNRKLKKKKIQEKIHAIKQKQPTHTQRQTHTHLSPSFMSSLPWEKQHAPSGPPEPLY